MFNMQSQAILYLMIKYVSYPLLIHIKMVYICYANCTLHEFLKFLTTVYVIYYGNLQFTANKNIRHFYVQIKDILLFFLCISSKNKIDYYATIFNVSLTRELFIEKVINFFR